MVNVVFEAGSGVYAYEQGDPTPRPSEATAAILAEVQREARITPREIKKEEITRRLVLRMVSEAFYIVEEGIAQRESDLDVAMVLGTGFPDVRGGLLKFARALGLDRVVAELEELADRFGGRFSPCGLLGSRKGAG